MKKVMRITKRTVIKKALKGTLLMLLGVFYVLAGGLHFPSDSVSRLVNINIAPI